MGKGVFLGIVIALMIFMSGTLFIEHLKTDVTTTRIGLDCTNSSISDGTKATCLVIDTTVIYFILILASISGGFISGKYS